MESEKQATAVVPTTETTAERIPEPTARLIEQAEVSLEWKITKCCLLYQSLIYNFESEHRVFYV